jgi:hypothetical protein
MPFVDIENINGRFHVVQISNEEASERRAAGTPVILLKDRTLTALEQHDATDRAFQDLLAILDYNNRKAAAMGEWWFVVFRVPLLTGEVKRGPFDWDTAVKERALVAETVDPGAYFLNAATEQEVR